MALETVNFEMRENVAIVTLNRPEALNSLSMQLVKDLRAALDLVVEHRARAVVLTGAGRAFSAGGDLREMRTITEQTGSTTAFFEAPLQLLHDCVMTIRQTPVPFVAAVNGVCAGAGTNFALACDIVFAAESATLNEGFVKIGLTPDCGGTYFLPRLVGEKQAAALLMTGESVTAQQAQAMGMINRAFPDDELMDEALKLAAKLAQMPTAAIGRIKQMLAGSMNNSLAGQLDLEHRLQIESGASNDFREGVRAFFEKRQPSFTGD